MEKKENNYVNTIKEKMNNFDWWVTSFVTWKIFKILIANGLSFVLVMSIINLAWSQYFLVLDWWSLISLYVIIFWIGLLIMWFLDMIIDILLLLLKKLK